MTPPVAEAVSGGRRETKKAEEKRGWEENKACSRRSNIVVDGQRLLSALLSFLVSPFSSASENILLLLALLMEGHDNVLSQNVKIRPNRDRLGTERSLQHVHNRLSHPFDRLRLRWRLRTLSTSNQQQAPSSGASTARRDLLLSIQEQSQSRWAEEKVFESDAPGEGEEREEKRERDFSRSTAAVFFSRFLLQPPLSHLVAPPLPTATPLTPPTTTPQASPSPQSSSAPSPTHI